MPLRRTPLWVLGAVAGPNAVTASVADLAASPVVIRAIGCTSGIEVTEGSGIDVKTIRPAAIVRMRELTDLGLGREDLEDAALELNDKLWRVKALMPKLEWIVYLSTVGVYGDHQGAWVNDIKVVCNPEGGISEWRVNMRVSFIVS